VRLGLAAGFGLAVLGYVVWLARSGWLSWRALLPLHLCDMLIIVAIVALLTRAVPAFELLWFWGGSGALLALLTPIVTRGFPDPQFLIFFGFHAGVVASAWVLAAGCGMRPRPRAALRVFVVTNGYAACVALVNLGLDTNYMFLRAKPATPTLLDWLGPWPWYIVAAEGLALVAFLVLEPVAHAAARVALLTSDDKVMIP
jgi:hypothetical integral membrane protein (TIGR02206 family)